MLHESTKKAFLNRYNKKELFFFPFHCVDMKSLRNNAICITEEIKSCGSLNLKRRLLHLDSRGSYYDPTDTFTILELKNPLHDVSELYKTSRSSDLEASKL